MLSKKRLTFISVLSLLIASIIGSLLLYRSTKRFSSPTPTKTEVGIAETDLAVMETVQPNGDVLYSITLVPVGDPYYKGECLFVNVYIKNDPLIRQFQLLLGLKNGNNNIGFKSDPKTTFSLTPTEEIFQQTQGVKEINARFLYYSDPNNETGNTEFTTAQNRVLDEFRTMIATDTFSPSLDYTLGPTTILFIK